MTVTQDGATDQPSSISLTLTHNGDFFSPRMDTLNLTSDEGTNLNLTGRHKRNGKLYYYLSDRITHTALDNLLNNGANTTDTQESGRHNGSDDARSVIIDGYALILPTVAEIRAFFVGNNDDSHWLGE